MWQSIVTALLPIAIKIINIYFEKREEHRGDKIAWINFLKRMEEQSGGSVRIHNSVKEQLNRLRSGE